MSPIESSASTELPEEARGHPAHEALQLQDHGLVQHVVVPALVVPNLAAGQTCTLPPSGLVSWWTGDVDASDRQSSNDGVLTSGATAGAPGFVGGAFDLDGIDDRIITTDPNVNLPNLTVAAWINPDDVSSHLQRIVTKFNGTGSTAGI